MSVKVIVLLTMIVLLSSTVSAVTITMPLTANQSQKDIVEKHYGEVLEDYPYIEKVVFTDGNIKKRVSGLTIVSWWDNTHECFGGTMYVNWHFRFGVFQHELGHFYELCELKKDVASESFAESFRVDGWVGTVVNNEMVLNTTKDMCEG